MKKYTIPDKSEWAADDPKQKLHEKSNWQQIYNDFMPSEAPALIAGGAAFGQIDTFLLDAVSLVGGTALDVGCGNGRLLVALASKGIIGSGIGIDVSDVMVENAMETATNHDVSSGKLVFLRCTIEEFLIDRQFDVIIATEIIEHIFRLRMALRRIVLLLHPDGVFVGATPEGHVCDSLMHLHYFSQESLIKLLSDYFEDVVVRVLDYTGEGEAHLMFACHKARRADE